MASRCSSNRGTSWQPPSTRSFPTIAASTSVFSTSSASTSATSRKTAKLVLRPHALAPAQWRAARRRPGSPAGAVPVHHVLALSCSPGTDPRSDVPPPIESRCGAPRPIYACLSRRGVAAAAGHLRAVCLDDLHQPPSLGGAPRSSGRSPGAPGRGHRRAVSVVLPLSRSRRRLRRAASGTGERPRRQSSWAGPPGPPQRRRHRLVHPDAAGQPARQSHPALAGRDPRLLHSWHAPQAGHDPRHAEPPDLHAGDAGRLSHPLHPGLRPGPRPHAGTAASSVPDGLQPLVRCARTGAPGSGGDAMTTPTSNRWRFGVFTTDHRSLAILYLLLALAAVILGTLLSLAMRIHRIWPAYAFPWFGVPSPEQYLALVTMHGTLMVFFVLTVVPQSAFPNLVLPDQLGAARMALPRLNAAAFWISLISLLVLLAAFFVPQGAPISGWTSYPPLSAFAAAGPGQGTGMDLWLVSIALFCIAAMASSISFLATIFFRRAQGMRFSRLPLTVWSWIASSGLTVTAFIVLFAAAVMLLA